MVYETQQQWENRIASPDSSPTILEQAYPSLATSRPMQAEIALDIRKAGNLKQVIDVVTDEPKVREVVANFVHDLEGRIDTGKIDLPGLNDTEKTGAVVAVLIEEARQLAEPANAKDLIERNSELKHQVDEVMRIVTPDQMTLVATVEEQAARIAALEAQLDAAHAEIAADRLKIADRDRIIFKKSSEGFRDRVTRMKTFGSVAISQLRAS